MEIKEDKIIVFPQGLPGFFNLSKFILLEEPETNGTFYWLQSIEDGDISLLLTRPTLFMPYNIEVDREALDDIEINENNQGEIFTVVNIPDDFKKATTNLMAPIFLNSENMKGKQVILSNSNWAIKHPLFEQQNTPEGGK